MALLSPAPTAPRWGLNLPGMNSVTEPDLLDICKGAAGRLHIVSITPPDTLHCKKILTQHLAAFPHHAHCPLHTLPAHSFKAQKAALWGGRFENLMTSLKACPRCRCLETNISCYLSSPQPSLALLQVSHEPGFQAPVLDMHAVASFLWGRSVPEAWEMRFPMRNPIHAVPLQLLHGTQFVPRGAAQGEPLPLWEVGKITWFCPTYWSTTAPRTGGLPS